MGFFNNSTATHLISLGFTLVLLLSNAFADTSVPVSETIVIDGMLNDSFENAGYFDHETTYVSGSTEQGSLSSPLISQDTYPLGIPGNALFSGEQFFTMAKLSEQPKVFWRKTKIEEEGTIVLTLEHDAGTEFGLQAFNSCKENLCNATENGNQTTCTINAGKDYYYFKVTSISGNGAYTLDVDFLPGTTTGEPPKTCLPAFIEAVSPAIDPELFVGEQQEFELQAIDPDYGSASIQWQVDGNIVQEKNFTIKEACLLDNNTDAIDQQNNPESSQLNLENSPNIDPNANAGMGTNTPISQSFIPAQNARITSVSLPLNYYTGSPGSITLNIETDRNNGETPSGNKPDNSCTSTIEAFTTPKYPENAWIEFQLGSNCLLNAGERYWIVLYSQSSSSKNTYLGHLSTANNYPDGVAQYYDTIWKKWNENYDLIFKVSAIDVQTNASFGKGMKLSQSFAPEKTGDITGMQFYLSHLEGIPNSPSVRIETDYAGKPSGEPANEKCSSIIPGFSSPTYPSYAWTQFPFQEGCLLRKGEKYWAVLETSEARFVVNLSTTDNYAGGKTLRDGGNGWEATSESYDLLFRQSGKECLQEQEKTFNDMFYFYSESYGTGQHTVKAVASDGKYSSEYSWLATVSQPEMPPEIVSFSPQENPAINEGETMEFSVTATDPNNDALVIEWFLDGNKAAENTYSFTYPAGFDSSGTHEVKVTLSDGLFSAEHFWTVTVNNVNRKPAIDSFTPKALVNMEEGSIQEFGITVSDQDNDELSIGWQLDGQMVSENTNNYSYAPGFSDAGEHTVKAIISDGIDSIEQAWIVRVNNTNRPVLINQFSPENNPEITEGQEQLFRIDASDPDNDTITLKWLFDGKETLGNSPEYTLQTDYESAGLHTVKATASDGSISVEKEWTINVKNNNRIPRIESFIPGENPSISEGENTEFWIIATDPDQEQLHIDWFLDGKKLQENSATFTYTPGFDSAGQHEVKAVVSDGESTAEKSWEIEVKNINRAPEITAFSPSENLSIIAGQKQEFSITAVDADNDPITIEWLVNGITEKTRTGIFSFETINRKIAATAVFELKAIISDGAERIEKSWQVEVTKPNMLPELELLCPDPVAEGQKVEIAFTAGDADNDVLAYSSSNPAFTLNGNAFSWQTGTGNAGTYHVTITASDGKDSISQSCAITVIPEHMESFNYTITATGTETWQEETPGTEISLTTKGRQSMAVQADTKLNYYTMNSGGWNYWGTLEVKKGDLIEITKNVRNLTVNRNNSFIASGRGKGIRATAQAGMTSRTAERIATKQGSSGIKESEGEKLLEAITIASLPEKGGTISSVRYTITDNSERIYTFTKGNEAWAAFSPPENSQETVSFTYTITGTWKETWTETIPGQEISLTSNGEQSMTATANGTIEYYTYKNGVWTKQGEASVQQGDSIRVARSGKNKYFYRNNVLVYSNSGTNVSGIKAVQPPTSTQKMETGTAQQAGNGFIKAGEPPKQLTEITIQALPQKGGAISGENYTITDNSEKVRTFILGKSVWAEGGIE